MYECAKTCGQNAVILCDRGVLDGRAYVSSEEWSIILDELSNLGITAGGGVLSTAKIRDRRYDAVLHLVTAAYGAEKHYSLLMAEGSDCKVRHESPELARTVDSSTLKAWEGHPHLYVIDNCDELGSHGGSNSANVAVEGRTRKGDRDFEDRKKNGSGKGSKRLRNREKTEDDSPATDTEEDETGEEDLRVQRVKSRTNSWRGPGPANTASKEGVRPEAFASASSSGTPEPKPNQLQGLTGFQLKMKRATNRVLTVLGEHPSGSVLRKFQIKYTSLEEVLQLVKRFGEIGGGDSRAPATGGLGDNKAPTVQLFQAETTYLPGTRGRERVRMRAELKLSPDVSDGGQGRLKLELGEGVSYYHQKLSASNGNAMLERQLDGRSYYTMVKNATKNGKEVTCKKQLAVFRWGNAFYELNIFETPSKMCILEVVAESRDSEIEIPPFLRGTGSGGEVLEVTSEQAYSSFEIAQKMREEMRKSKK